MGGMLSPFLSSSFSHSQKWAFLMQVTPVNCAVALLLSRLPLGERVVQQSGSTLDSHVPERTLAPASQNTPLRRRARLHQQVLPVNPCEPPPGERDFPSRDCRITNDFWAISPTAPALTGGHTNPTVNYILFIYREILGKKVAVGK